MFSATPGSSFSAGEAGRASGNAKQASVRRRQRSALRAPAAAAARARARPAPGSRCGPGARPSPARRARRRLGLLPFWLVRSEAATRCACGSRKSQGEASAGRESGMLMSSRSH